ncbi:response regulator, partial [Streptomyces sp. NPDC048491]
MAGKNFAVRTTPLETAAVTDAAIGALARRLTAQLLDAPSCPAPADPEEALALLHVLDQLRSSAERLQRAAATAAA